MELKVVDGKKIVTIDEDEFCNAASIISGGYIMTQMKDKSLSAKLKKTDELSTIFGGMAKALFDEKAFEGLKDLIEEYKEVESDYTEDDEDEEE